MLREDKDADLEDEGASVLVLAEEKRKEAALGCLYAAGVQKNALELLKSVSPQPIGPYSDVFKATCHGILRARGDVFNIIGHLLRGEFASTD
jgi:hypothetical protein